MCECIRTIETGGAQAAALDLCTECVHPAYLCLWVIHHLGPHLLN